MPFPLESDALMRLHFDAALARSVQVIRDLLRTQIDLALQLSNRRVDAIFQVWWMIATHVGTDHSREFVLQPGAQVELDGRAHEIDFSVLWKRMDFPWAPIQVGVQLTSEQRPAAADFMARRAADIEREQRDRAVKELSDAGWEILEFDERRVSEDPESCVREALFAAEIRVSEVLRPRERTPH